MNGLSTVTDEEPPAIDSRQAVDLVTKMLAIPGKSCEELAVIEFIQGYLRKAHIPDSAIRLDQAHKKSPAGGEVGNLVVKLPGTVRGPRRMLVSHVDTVPLCVGARPIRRGKTIESRDKETALGADNRAGASLLLITLLEILRRKLPHPPLTFFWPVQEEIGLLGARFANLKLFGNPKLCFNWDGSIPNAICIGATGGESLTIHVEGIASHAGVHPERGASAMAIAGLAVADLVENGWHGRVIKGKQSGTSNIGVVSGGDATNVVTPSLTMRAEARSHNPAFRARIIQAYKKAFQQAAKKVKNEAGKHGRVRVETWKVYESFRLPETEPCVVEAEKAVRAVRLEPYQHISDGGLDANWLTAHGLPTVTMGCGQRNVHTVNEQLDIEMYLAACRIGLWLATRVD